MTFTVSLPLMLSLTIILSVGAVVCLGIAQLGAGFTAIGVAREKGHGWLGVTICLTPLVGVCLTYVGVDHAVSNGFDWMSAWTLISGPLLLFVVPLLVSLGYLLGTRQSIRWAWKYLFIGLFCLFSLVALVYYLFSSGMVMRT
ncbi:MAG: hypothetical protein LBV45_11450 [Xanthomonadaceae bacterium]|nr:hypothetical protein [Xanthomonadaceae bacterium]